jgi:hypothetical protein
MDELAQAVESLTAELLDGDPMTFALRPLLDNGAASGLLPDQTRGRRGWLRPLPALFSFTLQEDGTQMNDSGGHRPSQDDGNVRATPKVERQRGSPRYHAKL